jgi:hypothetical protein
MGNLLKPGLTASFALFVCLASFAQPSISPAAPAGSELQNWFNDPFFQFTAVVQDCPVPLGPLIAASERAAQAQLRAQKNASCAQAGACHGANAYAQDAEIASALKDALKPAQLYTHSPLVNSSLWATVQARVVTIEGCVAGDVPPGYDETLIRTQFETMMSALPHVRQAVVLIRTSSQARAGLPVPYKVRP